MVTKCKKRGSLGYVIEPRANLCEADLAGAKLYGANLAGANLCRADLSKASLSEADLSEADLSRANLSGAYLYNANLYKANLSEADLSKANLSKADLSGADLAGANLCGANLSKTQGILVIGETKDGYQMLGNVRDGVVWIYAGCRAFTVDDARKHWKKTRKPLNKIRVERLQWVDFIEAQLRQRM